MYHIYSDYDNYRWTDYNRWSNSREVDNLIAHLLGSIESRKKSGYRISMKVIVMDLYHSYLTDREQFIAYHRGKDFYLNSGEDHQYINHPNITHAYFVGSVSLLMQLNLVEHHTGGYFYNQELGEHFTYVSRMRANERLTKLWGEYKITPEVITKFKPDDLIKLKGPKEPEEYTYKGKTKTRMVKPPMKCPNTPAVRKMIKIIERYNNLLERTNIDVDVECMTPKDRDELVERLTDMEKGKRYILRLADKGVYRVFNNGRMDNGGRFYGAWWIGAPGIVRKYITINGKPTIELDYSGIHVHLLYALKGINYADLNEDTYTLDDGIPDRDLNKLILLTAFNAEDAEDTASAVFDELRNEGLLKKYKLNTHQQIFDKLDLLKIKHKPIAGEIANNYGTKLQYYDSCIIERLIDHFTEKNKPILTVHDSIICSIEESEYIKDKMWQFYSETVDRLLNCKIKYVSINPHAKSALKLIHKYNKFNSNNYFQHIYDNKLNIQLRDMFRGKVPPVNNTIINIKQELRNNLCSNKCNHNTRIKYKLKYKPTIKLELIKHPENFTNVISIK